MEVVVVVVVEEVVVLVKAVVVVMVVGVGGLAVLRDSLAGGRSPMSLQEGNN